MFGLDHLNLLFVAWAFLFQIVLIIHFAIRRVSLETAIEYGWLVYSMAIPAVLLSLYLLWNGQNWQFWIGGFIFAVWAIFGHMIEYIYRIEFRSPARPAILIPYVIGYLATLMFYWFPLGNISKPLWYAYALLFIISTILNITSHHTADDTPLEALRE